MAKLCHAGFPARFGAFGGEMGEMGASGKCKGMGSSSQLPQSPQADVSIDPGLPTPLSLLKISRSLVCQHCWTRCQPRAINTRLLFPSEVFLLPSHRPGSLPGQAEHHRAEGKITARVPAGPVPAPGDTQRPSSPVLPWLPALLAEKNPISKQRHLLRSENQQEPLGLGPEAGSWHPKCPRAVILPYRSHFVVLVPCSLG